MATNRSITFFEDQFRRQSQQEATALNPFEIMALPYLRGDVLDFGCGMGSLTFAAASRGCTVTALDASPTAIAHIQLRAASEKLAINALQADLSFYPVAQSFDVVCAIGLLMFFDCRTAMRVLSELQSCVRPGGVAVINVLVQGTTYLDMFDAASYCLFDPDELAKHFADWRVERLELDDFDAPGNTVKRFCTVIARKPVDQA